MIVAVLSVDALGTAQAVPASCFMHQGAICSESWGFICYNCILTSMHVLEPTSTPCTVADAAMPPLQ